MPCLGNWVGRKRTLYGAYHFARRVLPLRDGQLCERTAELGNGLAVLDQYEGENHTEWFFQAHIARGSSDSGPMEQSTEVDIAPIAAVQGKTVKREIRNATVCRSRKSGYTAGCENRQGEAHEQIRHAEFTSSTLLKVVYCMLVSLDAVLHPFTTQKTPLIQCFESQCILKLLDRFPSPSYRSLYCGWPSDHDFGFPKSH